MAKKIEELFEKLPEKEIYLVSSVPIKLLEHSFLKHIYMRMSWTEESHECCLYGHNCH